MLKKQLKKFSSKIWWHVSGTHKQAKSKFKEKNSKSVWCQQCIFPETTTFKETFPKLECKSNGS